MQTEELKKHALNGEYNEIVEKKVSDKITKIILDKETQIKITEREKKEKRKDEFERKMKFYEEVFCDNDFIVYDKIIASISGFSEEHWAKINPETVELKVLLGLISKRSFLAEEPKETKLKRIAGCCYAWILERGGKFYNSGSELVLVYSKKVYFLDKKENSVKRSFNSFLYDLTGIITGNQDGKIIIDTLLNIVSIKAIECEMRPPVFADVATKTIYFSMCNEEREILKITKDGITIIHNGDNGLLVNDVYAKMKPFKFIKDVDTKSMSAMFRSLFTKSLSCKTEDSDFLRNWVSCFLFSQMVSTRPLMRLEGASGSGKTTALKIMTTLLYGEQQQKRATNAANYSDGAINPLIALDQVEVVNVDQNLTDFLLMSATGTVNEKRKQGSDTEIISERVNCLVCSSGIEPLRGDLAEINNRTFVIKFEMPDSIYIENDVMQDIKNIRNELMSLIVLKTQKMLKLIDDKIMASTMQKIPKHSKYRCNEYLSLMYLMENCENEPKLSEFDKSFSDNLIRFSFETEEISFASNYIVTCLCALFTEGIALNSGSDIDRFFEFYGMHFDAQNRALLGFRLNELFVAMSKSSKKNNINFPYNTPAQFIQRFTNEKQTIEKCGFEILVSQSGGNKKIYTIVHKIDKE